MAGFSGILHAHWRGPARGRSQVACPLSEFFRQSLVTAFCQGFTSLPEIIVLVRILVNKWQTTVRYRSFFSCTMDRMEQLWVSNRQHNWYITLCSTLTALQSEDIFATFCLSWPFVCFEAQIKLKYAKLLQPLVTNSRQSFVPISFERCRYFLAHVACRNPPWQEAEPHPQTALFRPLAWHNSVTSQTGG